MPAKKNIEVMEKTSHMSKSEIQARKESQVKAPSDNIVAPKFLKGQNEHNLFKYYVKELQRTDIVSNIDANALGRLALLNIRYNEIIEQERNINIASDIKTYQGLQKIEQQIAKDILTLEREFGMTSSSRSKLVVVKATNKPKNPLIKILKDDEDE